MSDNGPRVAQACPIRTVVVSDSFRFQAVDATAELTVGHEFRQLRRDERGIPADRSILHPDQPKFAARGPAQLTSPPFGQKLQKPLEPLSQQQSSLPESKPNVPAPGAIGLGLEAFVGKFEGTGFNTILRPQNGPNGQRLSDNLFELNFTHETMTFLDWKVLKDVPNRGFNLQEDVNLRGIPYTQEIFDLANGATGKPDLPLKDAPGIHFEQGLFMRTPALTPFVKNGEEFVKGKTILGPTITRMASIPHGTTINAQCLEPTTRTTGAPPFGDLTVTTILPFKLGSVNPTGSDASRIFPQLDFDKNVKKDQIPMDMQKFKDAGTITKAQWNNPNNFLKQINDKKKIIDHVTFTVDTRPTLALWGGGTSNIAHLAEKEVQNGNITTTHIASVAGQSLANANAVRVVCQYWISTVEDVITIPVYDKATLPRINSRADLKDKPTNIVWKVVSPAETPGVKKPTFQIMLDKVTTEFKAKVRYTQIQYAQNVTLDFGQLSWPHLSVATLVPADPIPISNGSTLEKVV